MNKIKRTIIVGLALCALAVTAMAETPAPAEGEKASAAGTALQRGWENIKGWTKLEASGGSPLFKAGETHLDLSGTYTANESQGIEHVFTHNIRGGVWGVNVGVTYFPSKYLGLGFDATCTDIHDPGPLLIDRLTLNTILRYPIDRVAPYLIAGVGRDFEGGDYSFQAGPGFEVRVNRNVGLFSDVRYQWKTERGSDQLLARAGLRFVF